ncbi:MAG: hypothetical protein K6T85_06490 [Gorillibacterium sp.]|nr:hypothetical protein [Gorillibacterium sp.]
MENEHRHVVGYWFGTNKAEISRQCRSAGYSSWVDCLDTAVVYGVYQSMREVQKNKDWSTRVRLPLAIGLRHPWKGARSGWYLMKSRNAYPLHISVIHKKKYSLWLEHTGVCDNEQEFLAFIEKVKMVHKISLQPIKPQGGTAL